MIMLERLDTSKVEFSQKDRRKELKIPKYITSDLARLDGIIRSDGNVVYGKDHHNDVSIFGHSVNDKPFLLYYVVPIIKKVHGNVPIKIHKYPSSGQCLKVEIHSKAIASFYNKVMNIPTYKRDFDFELHPLIIKDKEMAIINLQNYFDGDGCICFSPGTRRYTSSKTKINYYPLIDWITESSEVAEQIKQILLLLKFNPFIMKHMEERGGRIRHVVRIGGRYNYERFLSTFTSNNPNHLTKILIYEIYGFCPPNTTLIDRVKILQGKLTPESFYNKKVQKIRPIIMKENEEKILRALSKRPRYFNQIKRDTNLYAFSTLRRLEKFEQIKCLGMKRLAGRPAGKLYEITEIGKMRINRVSKIIQKLKNQFNLKL
jgi:DNA-binding HxlR family transcriptional regulator